MIARISDKFMNNNYSIKKLSRILTAIYVVSLIPMLILSMYNFPSADDYSMADDVHRAFMSSGSVFVAIAQAFKMAYYYFMNWTGYYTSDFLMAIPLSVFNERLYVLTTFILVGMFTFGTVYFMKALFVKTLKIDKYVTNCLTMLLLIISIQCMPGERVRVEAFYWYAGAVNYIFLYGLGLVFVGLLISIAFDKKSSSVYRNVIIASILGIFIGGGNYMTSLSCAIAGAVLSILVLTNASLTKEKRNGEKLILIPCILEVAGLICACFAPGNSNRESKLTGMSAVKAVLVSLYNTFDTAISDYMTWAVACLFIICIPFLIMAAKELLSKRDAAFSHPFIVIAFCFLLTSANITPPLYAMSNYGAGRMQAIFWTQFVLLLLLALFELVGWIVKMTQKDNITAINDLSPHMSNFLLAAVFVFIFGSVMCVKVNSDYYTSTSAATDIFNGDARAYLDECIERSKILNDTSKSDVELKKFTVEPTLLFISDIGSSEEDDAFWINEALCDYYSKNSIIRID